MLAHNLIRWTATIGQPPEKLTVARTLRMQLVAVPGRLVNGAGRRTLRLPVRWPWATQFTTRLETIWAPPLPSG